MASPICKRCPEPVVDPDGVLLSCPNCAGPIEDECARCGRRETRGEELRRCIGCGEWLCARPQCSRQGYENLARRHSGRVCATCFRRREIVLQSGAGKGAGSAAGVEAIERARYYLYEATQELDDRLRKLSIDLAERITGVVETRLERLGDRTEASARAVIRELEAATSRQLGVAAEKLGRALEDALARGVARGVEDVERGGRSLLGEAGDKLRVVRLPLVAIALALLVANGAITVGLVLALR